MKIHPDDEVTFEQLGNALNVLVNIKQKWISNVVKPIFPGFSRGEERIGCARLKRPRISREGHPHPQDRGGSLL